MLDSHQIHDPWPPVSSPKKKNRSGAHMPAGAAIQSPKLPTSDPLVPSPCWDLTPPDLCPCSGGVQRRRRRRRTSSSVYDYFPYPRCVCALWHRTPALLAWLRGMVREWSTLQGSRIKGTNLLWLPLNDHQLLRIYWHMCTVNMQCVRTVSHKPCSRRRVSPDT